MNHHKMTTVAKFFDTFAGICSKILGAAAVVCVMVAVLLLIFGDNMYASGSASLHLDFLEISLAENGQLNKTLMELYLFVGLMVAGILCFAISKGLLLFRRILAPMKEGHPFEPTASENLRKIAWLTLITGSVTQMAGIAERILLTKAFPMEEIFSSDAIERIEYSFTIDFTFVGIFCIIMLLSYIFAYGQVLQKESDETL